MDHAHLNYLCNERSVKKGIYCINWSGDKNHSMSRLFPSLCFESDFINKSQIVTSIGHSISARYDM